MPEYQTDVWRCRFDTLTRAHRAVGWSRRLIQLLMFTHRSGVIKVPLYGVWIRAVDTLRRQGEKKAQRRLKSAKAPPFFQAPF